MKTHLEKLIVGLVFLATLTQAARATVTFFVTPAAVSNTYNGTITLQIGGLTNTETVVVQKFLDLNTNGLIDGGDWLVQQFTLTDGQAGMVIGGVTNFNVPCDTDGTANGQITASLYQNGDFRQHIIGNYLYRLSSPVGHFGFITIPFVVTNFPFAQKFTGNIVSNNTSTTVPNAVLFLFPPGANDPPEGETVANNAGNYTISAPPGTYSLTAVKSNYLGYLTTAPVLTLSSGQTTTTNLTLTQTTASISGSLVDAGNSSIVLPGVMVAAKSTSGQIAAVTMTDTNGNFYLPVGAGAWLIKPDDASLVIHGYLGPFYWNNATAGTSGNTLDAYKATALIYGSVLDVLGNPMPGIDVYTFDSVNELYETDGNYTDTNGNYVLGVLDVGANDYWYCAANGDNQLTNYLFSQETIDGNLSAGQTELQDFTGILATNHITGWLKDNYGNPIAGVEIYDYDETPINGIFFNGNGSITDTNGNYSLNVCNGTWDVGVDNYGDNNSLPANYVSPADQYPVIASNNAVVDFTATFLPFQVTTTSLPNGTNGVAYNQTLAASYGQAPYTWTNITGALPPGLSLMSSGLIFGMPTNNGTYNFTVKVTDALSETATQALTLTVMSVQVTTIALPSGTNGFSYRQQLAAVNGQLPYSWMLISGLLPSGLTLASKGLISGIPVTNGMFSFTVQVTDAASNTATQALALTILGPANVTLQPPNSSVAALVGNNVTFSVSVIGFGPFSYQWQLNGTNLPNGIITTVAGNGIAGYSGNGGAATNAKLNYPWGVAVDTTGNLFIADAVNNVVRKVDINGIITTVAGNGYDAGTFNGSFWGDGGAATNAELYYPFGVALDTTGDLFIADELNNRIREVKTNGIINTIAGGGFTSLGDGGAATNAELMGPTGVAFDAIGNLFIADNGNNRVRRVSGGGIINTVAGGGSIYPSDGSAATNAKLFNPVGVSVDATGNVFIADELDYGVHKVGTNGIITTVAGNGTPGYSGDGRAATNAELREPSDVTVDAAGNMFIADYFNDVIRKVDTNGIITTVAGNGKNGYSGDGGAAANAELSLPAGVAVDATGNLFITEIGNNRVRKLTFSRAFPLGPTLTLNNLSFGNAGAYDVVVSNPYGSVTSSVVNLTVTLPSVTLSTPQIAGGSTNFIFLLSGPAGSNYVLQVSTNLINWNPVSTSTIPISGSINVSNALSGYKQGFYRVRLQ